MQFLLLSTFYYSHTFTQRVLSKVNEEKTRRAQKGRGQAFVVVGWERERRQRDPGKSWSDALNP